MSEVELLQADLSRLEKEREALRLQRECWRAVERLKQFFGGLPKKETKKK